MPKERKDLQIDLLHIQYTNLEQNLTLEEQKIMAKSIRTKAERGLTWATRVFTHYGKLIDRGEIWYEPEAKRSTNLIVRYAHLLDKIRTTYFP